MDNQVNAEVVAAINEAVSASSSVYASLRIAAEGASAELDVEKPAQESVREVVARYTEYFQGDHNLRAIFTDFLVLHYADSAPVSATVKRGGEEVEIHSTGKEATNLSKHEMRAAAKAAREDMGIGRASGGGRKARQPETKPGEALSFLAMLDRMLGDDNIAQLRKALKERGYQLRRVSK